MKVLSQSRWYYEENRIGWSVFRWDVGTIKPRMRHRCIIYIEYIVRRPSPTEAQHEDKECEGTLVLEQVGVPIHLTKRGEATLRTSPP